LLLQWFGKGYFEVVLDDNGEDIVLARGDHRFDSEKTLFFTVPSGRSAELPPPEESTCQDTEGLVVQVTDGTAEECWFISENDAYTYLCDWVDVALSCPVTCGICQDLDEVRCDSDSSGAVALDETVGEASCSFVEGARDRFGFACERTEVAFHCPVTCHLETCQD
jgi:hypothetical protein